MCAELFYSLVYIIFVFINSILMCVDCVLASPRIAQADPGQQTPHSKVVLSQVATLSHFPELETDLELVGSGLDAGLTKNLA
jgi:hypothetical protein